MHYSFDITYNNKSIQNIKHLLLIVLLYLVIVRVRVHFHFICVRAGDNSCI